mmetsp:Transcript_25428/g.65432  ORF Transcript_25428/g.65432 Transcript_25428/m.65432 type:complete len:206 (-) Transcript_25428:1091-1708(-)
MGLLGPDADKPVAGGAVQKQAVPVARGNATSNNHAHTLLVDDRTCTTGSNGFVLPNLKVGKSFVIFWPLPMSLARRPTVHRSRTRQQVHLFPHSGRDPVIPHNRDHTVHLPPHHCPDCLSLGHPLSKTKPEGNRPISQGRLRAERRRLIRPARTMTRLPRATCAGCHWLRGGPTHARLPCGGRKRRDRWPRILRQLLTAIKVFRN